MKKLVFLLMWCFALSAFASSSYTKDSVDLLDNSGNKIASITKGSKVKVLDQKGDKTLIELKGWSYEEEPNLEIFPAMGVTVTLAEVVESKASSKETLQKKEDEYENVWIEGKVNGWVLTSSLTNDFKSLWTKEASFASQRCGTCHGEPKIESYEAVQFPSLISLMKSQSGLTDDEEAFIVNYYQKNKIYGK